MKCPHCASPVDPTKTVDKPGVVSRLHACEPCGIQFKTQEMVTKVVAAPGVVPAKSVQGDLFYAPDFSAFWDAYPRKTGKGAAWKSWLKLSPPWLAVEKALIWQVRSFDWRKDNGAFIPLPATYLNQRRWEDEPKGVATPTGRTGMTTAEAERRALDARRAEEQAERSRQQEAERFRRERAGEPEPADWNSLTGDLARRSRP